MAKANSSRRSAANKVRSDFPLFRHSRGYWAKKVKGRTHYFGRIDSDPGGQIALEKWIEERDELLAGRKPRKAGSGKLTVQDGFNHYLDHLEAKCHNGERSGRWYEDAKRTLGAAVKVLQRNWAIDGLTPEDFGELAESIWKRGREGKRASPVTVRNQIHRVRGAFKWMVRAGLLTKEPAYGTKFDGPDSTTVDRHRNDKQARYFDRRQVRALLRATKQDRPRMHAAILLAINTGCQNVDIETLRARHIDLKRGWYSQPRSKRGKRRRAKLWPRTVKALRSLLSERPKAGQDDLVFIAKTGGAWSGRNCLSKEFARVKAEAGITSPRAGFQWLRHSFITEASQGGDLLAVQLACGHAPKSITENYIHRTWDPRLVAIADLVDQWLTGKGGAQ